MRFATRTFLWSFLPFALLLMVSFWTVQKLVEFKVRDGLRSSLRQTHASIARVRSKGELQNSRFLRIVGENTSLKAGLQLLLAEHRNAAARLTVEDQLREMCATMGFDYLLASDPDGAALAGVMRIGEQLVAVDIARLHPPQRGFLTVDDRAYQVASTPINQGDENIGLLSVGEYFDFSEFSTPAVLLHNGQVLKSSIPGIPGEEVESALADCVNRAECEVHLRGQAYISLPLDSLYFGEGYLLRSLQSVDSVGGPVQAILRSVFLTAGIAALLVAGIFSVLSSRSIVRPIGAVVSRLRDSERTGLLPEFREEVHSILEIRELTESFNRAATAIHDARQSLDRAYLEFVGSLASALDARDPYTAGHSSRVSEFSCAIARAIRLTDQELDEIRLGALLHDIGKIGIADSVLQKPGRLNREEVALIRRHPIIGRRILEGVRGFEPYLLTVELHHENWDGSGYPHGLRGAATPLAARIVHVADAYDAMTTDRVYRPGRSHEQAIQVLRDCAGTQFDEEIVQAFAALPPLAPARRTPHQAVEAEMRSLAQAVGSLDARPAQPSNAADL
jgi:HD-GYP domain-containing protein (c-di-GMP phosphodiesterase class II)